MSENFNFDNLFSGDYPKKTEPVTILSGQSVVRGQIMGRITASGKYRACNSGLVDGAQICDGIMADAVDASAADTPGIVYLTGEFNANKLTLVKTPTAGDTIAGHKQEARLRGIFFTGFVSVSGSIS